MPFRRARWATACAVLALVATTVTSAVAQVDDGGPTPAPPPVDMEVLAEYLGEDRLSPGLELMDLEGGGYAEAIDELWSAVVDRDAARATIDVTVVRLAELRGELDVATRRRTAQTARRGVLLGWLDEVADARAEVAVAEFMGLGSEDDLGLRALDRTLADEADALPVHGDLAWELLDNRQAELDGWLATTLANISDLDDQIEHLRSEIETGEATLAQARVTDFVRNREIPELADAVLEARWATTVVAVGQPLVVVDAYVNAARIVAFEQPECGLQWWMLAGIGRVESGHGTWGGSTVDANGDTSGSIIGLVLNGENGTAAIGDSDGGALDGDPVYDRAVGPMQFLPSSWSFFGRDGNNDLEVDPHNLYDAALAAGDLLCRVDGSLADDAGLRAALFSYNNHQAYVEAVLRAAAPFRSVVIPDPPPGSYSAGGLFVAPLDG